MCGSVSDATHSSSFLRNIIESSSLFVLLFWSGVLITSFPSIEMGGEVSVLACLFVGVVGLLSFFVYCYSGYYILEDLRLGYFVGLFSAFVISMCFLLLSEGSWSLVLFWDLLGISSFFLVFYFMSQNSVYGSVATAMSGRLGDYFLVLFVFSGVASIETSFFVVSLVLFLLFTGLTNSAQFPFCGWLPLAMAAPTPVSSLVHSSTLVTAGLFLFWSCSWIVSLGCLGSWIFVSAVLSLVFSGLVSLVEQDINKLVALSTLSQVSFCILGVSLGFNSSSYLHVLSHAFVKCGLFLQLGCLIYVCLGQQDRRLSSVCVSPLVVLAMAFSTVCLCGLFFTLGGASKEAILASFFSSSPGGSFLCLFLLGVSLTYLYSLRLLFGVLALGSGPSVETFSVISCISLLCPLSGLVYIACLLLNVIFVPSVFLGAENSLLYCVGLAIVFVLALSGVHNMRVPGWEVVTGDWFFVQVSRLVSSSPLESLMGKLMSDFFMALVLVRMVLSVTLFSNGSLLILSFLGAFILVV